MTVRRTAARSLGVLALVAPMSLAVVVATAPNAFAATGASWSTPSPTDGQVFTGDDSSVTVTGLLPACPKRPIGGGCSSTTSATLTVTAKGGQSYSTGSKTSTTSDQQLSVSVPAGSANDVWTAALTGNASRTFTIDQASTPTGFSALGSGSRSVNFDWDRSNEPGLLGYALADSNGTSLDGNITAADNCTSTHCAYAYYYDKDNPGNHGYQIVARRTSSSGGTVMSGPATTSATLTAPKPTPAASPAAAPSTNPSPGTGGGSTSGGSTSGGSTSGGSTGGSGNGGTSGSGSSGTIATGPKPTLPPGATNPIVASRRAFALTFNAFSPSLGIPKLPPLPSTDLPSISGEQPLPLGTYKPSLPYQGQTETTKTRSLLSSPTGFVQDTFTDPTQLAKSIAGALILLLVAAHMRRYIGSHVEE